MKQLRKLKLNQLSKKELNKNELSILLGGKSCTCPCAYANSGGSSTGDNNTANAAGGINPSYVDCGGGETNSIGSACGYWVVNDNYYCENPANCSFQPNKCGN